MSTLGKFISPPLLLLAITLPFYDFYNPVVVTVQHWKCGDICTVSYRVENLSADVQGVSYSIQGKALRRGSEPGTFSIEILFETTQNLSLEPGERKEFEQEIESSREPNSVSGRRIDDGGFKRWMRGLHAAYVRLMLGIE